MLKLDYDLPKKKRASTFLSLGLSEYEASENLIASGLYREAVVHLYFCSYYISQSLLQNHIGRKTAHQFIDSQLHKVYGRRSWLPRRYVELHSFLHEFRTAFSYKVAHVPSPRLVKQKAAVLGAYLKFAFKYVPKVETIEILRSIYDDNTSAIQDFSYDIYCPKTYSHHTRITFWQPPFYLDIFGPKQLADKSKAFLKGLKVNRHEDYVVGLNSRLDQYKPVHLLMLDIDSLDSSVEHELKNIGGVLLKSGRGFHFIGTNVLVGQNVWEREMKRLMRLKSLKEYLDRDHMEISLRRGYSTLRVTANKVKPTSPVFYKEL